MKRKEVKLDVYVKDSAPVFDIGGKNRFLSILKTVTTHRTLLKRSISLWNEQSKIKHVEGNIRHGA